MKSERAEAPVRQVGVSSYSLSVGDGGECAEASMPEALVAVESRVDEVVVEEPLEIRVHGEPVATTMRTPGADRELALGYLFSEGSLRNRSEVDSVVHCGRVGSAEARNVVELKLSPGTSLEQDPRERPRLQQLLSSACGVCGRDQILALREYCRSLSDDQLVLTEGLVRRRAQQLTEMQAQFQRTGGSHAALVVASSGQVVAAAEDVGRHNAVDKALGRMFLDDALPGTGCVLVVSSRASFEILQKACMAGIPCVICPSAPTSMAVELANEFGMTLIGFARPQSFNVYAGAWRIKE